MHKGQEILSNNEVEQTMKLQNCGDFVVLTQRYSGQCRAGPTHFNPQEGHNLQAIARRPHLYIYIYIYIEVSAYRSNFCLWGWMKSEVYKEKVNTREELVTRIMNNTALL
jgi:hypothetical protein